MRFAAEELADQARRFAAFTGVTKPHPTDRFFLVIGMTGSGKSTFIAQCTKKNVVVGHGLHSCTNSVEVFDFLWNGRRIYLVDTPGFNDTTRPDLEILDTLATYLSTSYANGVRIHGLIMLHPISDNRMTGSSLRNIEMMKAMCGLAAYHNLAIVTTMWPNTSDETEKLILDHRDAELLADDRFFGDLVARGANLFRHNETGRRNAFEEATSARRIVDHLVRQSDMHALDVLRLQKEIVDEGKTLGETTAGIAVAGELYKARHAHELELGGLRAEMNSQFARRDAVHAAQIRELEADVMRQLQKVEDSKSALRRRMDEMHRDEERAWKQKIRELDDMFRQQLAEKQQELLDMEESLLEIRQDMARRAPNQRQPTGTSPQREQMALQIAEHEEIMTSARTEISNTQDAYQKFKGQTGNILNGTANGVAAGLTSGMIAAAAGGAGLLLCNVM